MLLMILISDRVFNSLLIDLGFVPVDSLVISSTISSTLSFVPSGVNNVISFSSLDVLRYPILFKESLRKAVVSYAPIGIVVAEFCLQPFYNHIVVDGQHENTVINFKHVFQQFQYLNCIFRVDAIKIIDKKHESSSLTLSCQTIINCLGECISEFFRSGFIKIVVVPKSLFNCTSSPLIPIAFIPVLSADEATTAQVFFIKDQAFSFNSAATDEPGFFCSRIFAHSPIMPLITPIKVCSGVCMIEYSHMLIQMP